MGRNRTARTKKHFGSVSATLESEPSESEASKTLVQSGCHRLVDAVNARTTHRSLLSELMGSVAQTDVHVERHDDPQRVQEIVLSLVRNRAVTRVTSFRDDRPSIRVETPRYQAGVIVWRAPLKSPVWVEMAGYNSVCGFWVVDVSADGLRSPMPSVLTSTRRRWYRRAAVTSGDGLRFGGWPVTDLSYDGLSVRCDANIERLEVGAWLRRTLLADGERQTPIDAEIRGFERTIRTDICHLRVVPGTDEEQLSWDRIVERRLYPHVRLAVDGADALWRLYDKSGYFSLSGKHPSDFESLRAPFSAVVETLARAPQLGCHAVFPSKAIGLAGALSALKVYSGSWLGFQMAKVKGNTAEGVLGRTVLREIHLRTYEHIQRHGGANWVIAYPQVKPVWSRLVHHDLPRKYVERGEACVVRFHAIELAASMLSPDDDIGPASADELSLLSSTLERSRPIQYVEALDLTRSQLELSANKNVWHAAGLPRERVTLVSRRKGEPVAAAVAELAADGAHLFRLLDLVRLFPLSQGASEHYPRLLAAAGRWFGRHGKPAFVLYREEGTAVDLTGIPIVQDMGLADMSILAAARLPELLEYLHQVTAPSQDGEASEAPPPVAQAIV